MDSLIIELLSRTTPWIAALIYMRVLVRRAHMDCMRACEQVHREMHRLMATGDQTNIGGSFEASNSQTNIGIYLPPRASETTETPAPLPVARVHVR